MPNIPELVIVGGGSAGWIAASYINSVANRDGKQVNVTLIESPDIGRIGVGEATVPSIRETLSRIGIAEKDFLKASEGTFKSAIAFENWLTNEGEMFLHPFDQREIAGRSDTTAREWLNSQRNVPWADTVSIMAHLCQAGHAPKAVNWPDYGSVFPYAYHMDAEQFAETLATFSASRGVRHVRATVEDVKLKGPGEIDSVALDNGEIVHGDMFLDCTGQAAILIGRALGVGFVDFNQWLLCDSAVAMRVPYDTFKPDRLVPYTVSRALSSGWAWDIPLQTRRGRGYVYSSAYLSAEQAEAELRADEGAHANDLTVRHLKFRVGRRETVWKGNCIAVGLASGFIEPLESTALYTVEVSIAALLELIDFGALSDSERTDTIRASFNRNIERLYQEILEFVNLHYCLSQRDDTAFWREVQKSERIVEPLAEKLRLWEYKVPSQMDFTDPLQLFSLASYEYILFGMHYPQTGGDKRAAVPDVLQDKVRKSLEKMPSHSEWLSQL